MLSNHCGRKWSSRKSVPRQPTYSSLSRYPRSARQADDRQNSPSISVSDDNQKLTTNLRRPTVSSDLNGSVERKGQENRTKMNRINHHREFGRSMSRGSNSSQLTLMTSISKSFNEGNNNVAAACVNECLLKIQSPPRAVTLGKIF